MTEETILTFGSCLAQYTAKAYLRLYGGRIDGSVFHNRIDRFVAMHVAGTRQELPAAALEALPLDTRPGCNAVPIVGNQFVARTLGRHHLPPEAPGFLAALDRRVDLILLDNYIDLIARHAVVDGHPDSIFLLSNHLREACPQVAFEPDLLPVPAAIAAWHRLVAHLRARAPSATIVFLPFPFHHHNKAEIARRSEDFAASFRAAGCHVLPLPPVGPEMRVDKSHFRPAQYAVYARAVRALRDADTAATPAAPRCPWAEQARLPPPSHAAAPAALREMAP